MDTTVKKILDELIIATNLEGNANYCSDPVHIGRAASLLNIIYVEYNIKHTNCIDAYLEEVWTKKDFPSEEIQKKILAIDEIFLRVKKMNENYVWAQEIHEKIKTGDL